jgi:glycosyltransferase involved in cell wall biosynthesis
MTRSQNLIRIFTPSDASSANTNAQNLTVKEVVARLPEEQFHVTMFYETNADPRIAARKNTRLVKWTKRGNRVRLLRHCLFPPMDIYFFPRAGPLDRLFFDARNWMGLKTKLVTYIVMAMDAKTSHGMTGRSIVEGDVVVGNSKYVGETIQQIFGVQARTIYDGIDRRHYFAAKKREENIQPVVLYAGSFQVRKRVESVIEQAARWPAVQFRLAGKGETEGNCRQFVQRLECRNVTFLGHLSSELLGEEMRQADVFFFPSILEGNPQVLLQASACGLPCVAMDFYRSDYVINGKTGFLAASDAELSEGLGRLIADAALRMNFSAAAVRHADQFDWDGIARQWSAVFEEVLHQRINLRQRAS